MLSCYFASRYQANIQNIRAYKKIFQRYLYYFLILFPTTFISGFRSGIGIDYKAYLFMYNNVGFSSIFRSSEPLYEFITYATKFIFQGQSWGIFLVTSLLTLFIILKGAEFFHKEASIAFVLFIYYMVYYIEGFNIIRQMLALALIFYSFRYLLNRNLIKFIITIIIAALIHNSAIIALVFYLIPYKFTKKSALWTTFFYGTLFLIPLLFDPIFKLMSNLPIFSTYFNRYELVGQRNVDITILILETVTAVVPAILFWKTVVAKDPKYQLLVNICLLAFPVRYILFSLDFAWRVNYYITSAQLLLIPLIVGAISKNFEKKVITTVFVIVYVLFFVYYYIFQVMGPGIPYKSVFSFL